MTGVVVRPARVDEYDAVARLTIEAYRADGQLDVAASYAGSLADVAGRAAHGEVLVAVDGSAGAAEATAGVPIDGAAGAAGGGTVGGGVLGAVTFVLPGSPYAELSRAGEAEFRMLAVAPAAQGRGVGGALVRACLSRAARHGCSAVVISARDFAAPARRLYARLGFVRVPELDWSPAPGVDLIALRRDLADPAVQPGSGLPAEPAGDPTAVA
jgi:ribosomal protein S18 acetylase RimI-like enzyme